VRKRPSAGKVKRRSTQGNRYEVSESSPLSTRTRDLLITSRRKARSGGTAWGTVRRGSSPSCVKSYDFLPRTKGGEARPEKGGVDGEGKFTGSAGVNRVPEEKGSANQINVGTMPTGAFA